MNISTRRQFLASASALPFALRAMAQGNPAPRWVFLGTDKGKGIYRARWDAATGTMGAIELAAETDRPDFFAMHPTLPVLYTVDSVAGEKAGVSGYRVDRASGSLTLINRVSSHGDGPCAVSVGVDGREVFVANYSGGSIASYRVGAQGSLQGANSRDFSLSKPGVVPDRQEKSHMHCVVISPNDDFVLSCDLGADLIRIFAIGMDPGDKGGYVLHATSPYMRDAGAAVARPGSGPRHVAFHPNGKWVYCIHELDNTVDLYDWSVADGKPQMTLREHSVISTLSPGTPAAGNAACEIFVSHDGRFVYTCTRGVDQIVVYHVNPATGLLAEHQRVSCGGKIPRYIALDPSRKWLVCCNQGAPVPNPVGNVTIFANDPATGKLSQAPKVFAAETPMFTIFV